MKINRDENDGKYVIKRFEPGLIVINQDTYHDNLIITPDELLLDWRPSSISELEAKDFSALAQLKPELVILGTGEHQQFPTPALLEPLYTAQIGVECMSTQAACRTFNLLLSERRNVAAALLLR